MSRRPVLVGLASGKSPKGRVVVQLRSHPHLVLRQGFTSPGSDPWLPRGARRLRRGFVKVVGSSILFVHVKGLVFLISA
ncbi:uncharacterized protein BDZ99DRAFT_463062 [Mytilinidion resinicola]|uniref:Uncharacterized protein n=1 Tax=Mytilinidion resinicola TaxID=574789 RepID=A0A6A6YPK7_9PEZI|nr:uncharacterized protein BDZ99DRAFT_463062 [Mytilinidion resinicola]KAF2810483.1 hypothetical protein BDZ99DRAFT_463062 [Mytilinidion resinicola]